jgi:hypothetical protein
MLKGMHGFRLHHDRSNVWGEFGAAGEQRRREVQASPGNNLGEEYAKASARGAVRVVFESRRIFLAR